MKQLAVALSAACVLAGVLWYFLSSGPTLSDPQQLHRREDPGLPRQPHGSLPAPLSEPHIAKKGTEGPEAPEGAPSGAEGGKSARSRLSTSPSSPGGGNQPGAGARAGGSAAAAQKKSGSASPPILGKGTSELTVRVVNENGEALPEVSVGLEGRSGTAQGITGEDGTCTFSPIPADQYRIAVETEQGTFGTQAGVSLAPDEVKTVTLRIGTNQYEIRGRALDTKGNPLAGVRVELRSAASQGEVLDLWTHPTGLIAVQTDSEGFYQIGDLPKAAFSLTGFWPVTGERRRLTVSAPAEGVDLVFRTPFEVTVTGVCTDQEGRPLPNVTVSVIGRSPVSVRTAADGAYHLTTKTVSWSGTLYLRARKEGYRNGEQTITLDPDQQGESFRVDFLLQPEEGTGAVVGVVVDPEGEPVGGELVYLTSASSRTHRSAKTAPDGSFSFLKLEAAQDYSVTMFPRRRFKDFRKRGIVVPEGEKVELTVVLQFTPTGTVRGVAVDAEGEPLGGFLFRIRSAQSWSQEVKVVTGPDGSFLAEEVPAGDLMCDTRTTPHYSIRGLTLKEGEEKEVRLPFGVGEHEVEGIVTGGDGQPVAGVRVIFSWVRTSGSLTSTVQHSTITDPGGWYRLANLASGTYRVELQPPQGSPLRKTRHVTGAARVDFALPTP